MVHHMAAQPQKGGEVRPLRYFEPRDAVSLVTPLALIPRNLSLFKLTLGQHRRDHCRPNLVERHTTYAHP